jgi:polyphosphate kinase 2 (PPK2 family)
MLEGVDLAQKLENAEYKKRLGVLQDRLHLLGYENHRHGKPVVMVFEGWDAAGKGGTIRRIAQALDPRVIVVWPIGAPEGEDKTHHYLYRFWRRLPPSGNFVIFDRSWYGRVLVERVEGFARPHEWQRAYREINHFERALTDFGTILFKFWLHISPEEQLRRFQVRAGTRHKAWKLTPEDWRNRDKWPQYCEAVNEMLLRTSPPNARWTVVPAEDKGYARVYTLQTIVTRLEKELRSS